MDSNETILVVIRGPAASGKSTLASALQKTQPNIALIEQDYFRKTLLAHGSGSKELSVTLMKDAALTALQNRYHVIIEGILNLEQVSSMLDELFSQHPKNNYMFYFDVPFKETLRRHNTRPKSEHFGEEDMRKWYALSAPSHGDNEQIISDDPREEEILTRVRKITGL
jgi:predicted kinase